MKDIYEQGEQFMTELTLESTLEMHIELGNLIYHLAITEDEEIKKKINARIAFINKMINYVEEKKNENKCITDISKFTGNIPG